MPPGRPKSDKSKVQVTLRIDPDVLAHFKAAGAGWQVRMNEQLRKALPGSEPKGTPPTPKPAPVVKALRQASPTSGIDIQFGPTKRKPGWGLKGK